MLILAGCGSQVGVAGTDAVALGEEYGSCESADDHVDGAPALDYLSSAASWVQITKVIDATRAPKDGTWTFPATVEDPSGEVHEFLVHGSFWPGIDWGVQNGAQVWAALDLAEEADASAAYILVVAPDGSVFFPGDCEDQLLRKAAERIYGDDEYSSVLRSAIGLTGKALEGALDPEATPAPSSLESSPIILNPEDTSSSLLNQLTPVVVSLEVDGKMGNFTLCTRATSGWNDCAGQAAIDAGMLLNGYVDADGFLEVWLLDDHADTSDPIGKLGVVSVPDDVLSGPEIEVKIQVDLDPAHDGHGKVSLSAAGGEGSL
ncbi:MAG: hypothetical protein ACSLEW_10495 [Nocardioides sp.]